jgi:hypothetical protein
MKGGLLRVKNIFKSPNLLKTLGSANIDHANVF